MSIAFFMNAGSNTKASFSFPAETGAARKTSLYFSVCATLKLMTDLPLTLFTTASLPKFPMTCNFIILVYFNFLRQ